MFRGVGPYVGRFIALPELMMLTWDRQGQELTIANETYKCDEETFEAKPRVTAIGR